DHVDLQGPVGLQALVHVRRDLRRQEFVGRLGEDAGDVEGDVPDAQHGDLLRLQGPGARHVRVAVVPGDEVRGAVGTVQADAGDVQRAVGHGAGGEDHAVVERAQVVEVEIRAVVHIAEQADLRLVEHLVQGGDDALDPRVVGGDAVADQSERRRHALEDVDGHARFGGDVGLEQGVGRVDPGGAGSDDGDPQGAG